MGADKQLWGVLGQEKREVGSNKNAYAFKDEYFRAGGYRKRVVAA